MTKDIIIDMKGSEINNEEYRKDEKWSDKHEKLVNKWLKIAQENSIAHNVAGKNHKCKHVIFGLPSVILPIIFSPVCIALDGDISLPYVSMAGFITSGLFGAVDKFFDFSGNHQKHMDYSARYSDIISDIEYEMAKERQYRTDPDQWTMRIQGKLDYTSGSAPDL